MLQQDIRECGRRLHHTRVELLRSLAPYDDYGHWAASGAASCAHWIADTLDVAVGTAREWLRIAHALTQLPTVASAFTEHRLSYAAIRTLTRIAVDHPDHADDLVTLAVGVPARDLAPILAAWCAANEDDETRDRRHHRHTHLAIRTEPDGMAVLTLALPAISMGAVGAAIDARVMQGITQAPAHERNSLGHQRALAFLDLLTNHNTTVDTEIVVHIRSDGCTMHDGTPIADHTVAALIDTAFIRTLIHDADNHPSTPADANVTPIRDNAASSTNATPDASTAAPPNSSNTTTNPTTKPPAAPTSTNSPAAARPATEPATGRAMAEHLGPPIRSVASLR